MEFHFVANLEQQYRARLRRSRNSINNIVGFNNVTVSTNANGELIGELPDFKERNQSTSQDSRQFQIGFKFIF